jgi:CRISPR/Cas system-associated exonuclease Cas4 (RecB family)
MAAQPTVSHLLVTVSPSRLERLLACPLRIAFEQARPSSSDLTAAPNAVVGLAVHRTIAVSLAAPSIPLSVAWDQACDDLAARSADPRSRPDARRAYLRLERRLPQLMAFVEARAPTELLIERELEAPGHLVRGRPDLVILGQHPCVIDHKSGLVMAEVGPREPYENQLVMYAWLVESALGVEVDETALFSLRQGLVTVDVSARRARLIDEVLSAREAFNARVPGPQPASPSETSCNWCPFVGPCDSAWRALQEGQVDRLGWGEAVRGTSRTEAISSSNRRAAVALDIDIGTVSGSASIIDIPADRVADLRAGDRVAVWALTKRNDDPLTLAWHDGVSAMEVLVSTSPDPATTDGIVNDTSSGAS